MIYPAQANFTPSPQKNRGFFDSETESQHGVSFRGVPTFLDCDTFLQQMVLLGVCMRGDIKLSNQEPKSNSRFGLIHKIWLLPEIRSLTRTILILPNSSSPNNSSNPHHTPSLSSLHPITHWDQIFQYMDFWGRQ